MPKLIVISGSINSGKTTVSRLLTSALENTAYVHGDSLRHFVSWLPLEEAAPLTVSNIIAVSATFLRAGLNVLVDYPLAKAEYGKLTGALLPHASAVHAFVLSPRLEVAQSVRNERSLSDWEVTRIGQHYATGMHNPGYGLVIDNSEQTPEETARIILAQLEDS